MQKTDDYIRPRGYYDNVGNLLKVGFDKINMALSGITASAAQLNTLASGSIAYAASAGTLSGVTVTAGQINNILYGSAVLKYAVGSAIASDGMVLTHGLLSGLYGQVSPQASGIIAGCLVSATGIQFFIQNSTGIATSATVYWTVCGN